jgi:motility quorum-sensing regulator/GCU-specific mRNA interferase toxin
MTVKRTPRHDLKAIQAKFGSVDSLEITGKATRDAQKIGYSLQDIVDVVQALEPGDFVKSETARASSKSGRRTIGYGTTPTISPARICGCI